MTRTQKGVWAAPLLLCMLLSGAAYGQDAEVDSPEAASESEAEAEPKQWGRGPLEVRDPFILAYQRLSPWARSPETLAHLQVEASVRTTWANSYGFRDRRILIDAETWRADMTIRLGLFDRFEVGVTLPYEWRGGGHMDGFLEGFHETFGLPDGNRDKSKRDTFNVTGVEDDGSPFEIKHKGDGFVDLMLEGRALLTEGGELLPAASLTLRVRLPTGRSDFALADGVGVTFGLDLSKRLLGLPLIVYGSLAYTYSTDGHVNGLRVQKHRGFIALGIEFEANDWVSVVLHGWWENAREPYLFKGTDLTYGNYVTYLAFGFKLEPIEGLVIDVGALENVIDPDVTADLALLFNLSFRY